ILVGADDGLDRADDVDGAGGPRGRVVLRDRAAGGPHGAGHAAGGDRAHADRVVAAVVGDGDGAAGVEGVGVVARPHVELVVAPGDGGDGVVAGPAHHGIDAVAGGDRIAAVAPVQERRSGEGRRVDGVGAGAAGQLGVLDTDQGDGAAHGAYQVS